MRTTLPRRTLVAAVATAAAAAAGVVAAPAANADTLTGTFSIDSGSYFRMILPSGTTSGPFLANGNSTNADKTITPLSGSLTSGSYQGQVTSARTFFGSDFVTSTKATDPQTGSKTSVPTITRNGSSLSGDLSAFGVAWNGQVFNQGAPKPGGGLPGKTSRITGSINGSSYSITWTSQIVGGPFNNFTGLWHLTGTYSK
ncbi:MULTISPECIES: hypothetical protein [Tsukamurella]|uniref:Uncharacterized protein n=2 Tax=Tsukamurella TaxID=2060 RepID=A0A5C5RVF7_9ACTN|nr:hypothetical protein [Tsukamurella conjunctivitidis]NMD56306.1 hypothetical protein [Tsukamurella columbiensis]TWS26744.1 hypothetical protein FK530_22085 [Tsukamurella conjunctivitidis]